MERRNGEREGRIYTLSRWVGGLMYFLRNFNKAYENFGKAGNQPGVLLNQNFDNKKITKTDNTIMAPPSILNPYPSAIILSKGAKVSSAKLPWFDN